MQAMDDIRKQRPLVEISAKNVKARKSPLQFPPRIFRLCVPPVDGDLRSHRSHLSMMRFPKWSTAMVASDWRVLFRLLLSADG
ncbi:phosphatidylinositol 3,4,5-trisphosphate-dependent Rac exchanger 1 protein-like [Hyperolius riggenbachi]